MIDQRHLPNAPREIWFYAIGTALAIRQIQIPKEANTLSFTAIGPGGNGFAGAIGAAASGGGGGGSGGMTSLIVSANLLPKTIYAAVGAGGTTNQTIVSVTPSVANARDILLVANPGGNSASAAGGTAAAVASVTAANLLSLGQYTLVAGIIGTAGTATNGTSVTVSGGGVVCFQGAGGGGSSGGSGGNQVSVSQLYPTLLGGLLGDNPGANGLYLNRPFTNIGGAGGGGNNLIASIANNKGGNAGGYGSGGGGGGATALGSGSAGAGGLGAPGLLIMRWW